MLKEARTLVANGLADEVMIAGLWKSGLQKKQQVSEKITIVRLNCYFEKLDRFKFLNAAPFIVFYFKCLFLGIRKRVKIVNAHSLTTLPIAFFIKIFTG